MTAEQTKKTLERRRRELRSGCAIPMNKQGGEKKAPAFFMTLINMWVEATGVTTAEPLKTLGGVEAVFRLRASAKTPDGLSCASMRSGLEGAIRGERWHALPRPERQALWRRHQARCESGEGPRP